MYITKRAKRMMATVMTMALVLTTGSIIAPKKASAASEVGPETISAAKASVKEDGSALRFLVTATLPKTYTGDLGIKLTVGGGTEKTISLKNGASKLYSYVEDDDNATVGYSVAIKGIPGSAASTAIKAVGFAGEGGAISTATEVTRTVKQVANAAGYSFNEETGAMAYSPFAQAEVTGAKAFTTLKTVTYTVGEKIPTGFNIAFDATAGAAINLEIKVKGDDGNWAYANGYSVGTGRMKSCALATSEWPYLDWSNNKKELAPIGNTLSQGQEVVISAVSCVDNQVSDFKFTSIEPTGEGTFAAVDLTGVSAYEFAGTAGGYQPILTTKAIASDLTGKTLADYSKVVIECDETSNASLNYSIVAGGNETDAFIVYNKVAGTIEISLTDNFNPPGDYQKKYDNLAAAQALHASDVRLKVTAPKAGYKGKIIIKSVRFEK